LVIVLVQLLQGMLTSVDPVDNSEQQHMKKYSKQWDKVQLNLKKENNYQRIPAHVAESLRQVENSGVEKGGWTGGDAWFGSVSCAVHLKTMLGVHSTFVVKNNTWLFPKRALAAVLKARYPGNPQGHWVVMTTTILDVKLSAIVYAWSKDRWSYFITTMGDTNVSNDTYEAHYEDIWGVPRSKMILRPEVLAFVYALLPKVDTHNLLRQHQLALESCWPTKCPWTKLVIALVGMAVVDLYLLYLYNDPEKWQTVNVKTFSDILARDLNEKLRVRRLPPLAICILKSNGRLKRITNRDGETTKNIAYLPRDRYFKVEKRVLLFKINVGVVACMETKLTRERKDCSYQLVLRVVQNSIVFTHYTSKLP